MLEKPTDLHDETIITCLQDEYSLNVHDVEFLPIGADQNTAVYRATDKNLTRYFVKLRSREFNGVGVVIPDMLRQHNVWQVIAPLPNIAQQLWSEADAYHLILYPFVDGKDGFERDLADHHWRDLGRVLKHLHQLALPVPLASIVPREEYVDGWRNKVRRFQKQAQISSFTDPISADLKAFLQEKHSIVDGLVQRADALAKVLTERSSETVLCHADIHVGNMLIDYDDNLFVVDWDTLIIAPKERDLMFIGAGIGISPSKKAEMLFYEGYGQTQIDPAAFTYYRFERIVQDISEYCEQIFDVTKGIADRKQGLRFLKGQFDPGNEVDIALSTQANLLGSN